MDRSTVQSLLKSAAVASQPNPTQPFIGSTVLVQGWVRTRRDSKGFSFLEVNDGSCLANIQIVAGAELQGFEDNVLAAGTGAAVEVIGEVVASPGKGQSIEIKAASVKLVGACPEDFPLQKKRHTNEYLRTIAHLRPRTNTFGAVFRVRSAAAFAIHKFFVERGFVYLHSPIISTSDCEGAGQMFQVTTLDLEKPPRRPDGKIDFEQDFFAEKASLTVSGQLEGEIFATALSKIYTFGPTFRAENSNTPRHLAEFWMIEPEIAFCDLEQNMRIAEEFVKYVLSYVLEHCAEDMAFFEKWVEPGIIASLDAVAKAEFARMTYTEAISALEKSGQKFEYPVKWGLDLQTEHERYLTEKYAQRPVFVTNYPKEIKAFYMRLDPDGKTVSAMDLLAPRIGEIIGGSQREERESELRRRIAEMNLDEKAYWWYLELRKFGTVPHAGFGLGFERLILYLTGMQNIRDVVPFPRTPGSAAF
jgi:asparaginyl-tRNA synthetase